MKMQPSYVLEWQRMGTLLLSFYFIAILLTIAFFYIHCILIMFASSPISPSSFLPIQICIPFFSFSHKNTSRHLKYNKIKANKQE